MITHRSRRKMFTNVLKVYPKLEESYIEVLTFFKGDEKKALLWFFVPNPMLGEIRPIEMVAMGRLEKLEQFIADAKEQRGQPS